MPTKTPRTAPNLTAPAHPLRSLPYRLHLRISDVAAGRRDGRLDLAGLGRDDENTRTEAVDQTTPTSWLRNNSYQFQERAGSEFATSHRKIRGAIESRRSLLAAIPRLDADASKARSQLAAVPALLSESEARTRSATEKHLDDSQVAVRRHREHATFRSPLVAAVDAADAAVAATKHDIEPLDAAIRTAFEALVSRVERLRHFHNRRATAYERAYLRRLAVRGRGQAHDIRADHDLLAHQGLPAPTWSAEPCLWLADDAASTRSAETAAPV